MGGHFKEFDESFKGVSNRLVDTTILLFNKMMRDQLFSPSAKKFHYLFNLRDLAKISEGLMTSNSINYKNDKEKLFKLWVYEVKRVVEDKLICKEDISKFRFYLDQSIKFLVEGTDLNNEESIASLQQDSVIFTSFISLYEGESEKVYLPAKDLEYLKQVLKEKLEEYNETKI